MCPQGGQQERDRVRVSPDRQALIAKMIGAMIGAMIVTTISLATCPLIDE